MLVLSRKLGERIVIGEGDIVIRVESIRGTRVKLGIAAPEGVRIRRGEILTEPRDRESSSDS